MHSTSTFERTQSQYERKLARQKQLDMMEAAASGQPFATIDVASTGSPHHNNNNNNSDSASVNSRTSTGQGAPEGAIESARRFLWDEDDAVGGSGGIHHHATTMAMPSASMYDMYSSDGQAVGLMKTSTGLSLGPGAAQQQQQQQLGFGSRMANTIMGSFSRNNRFDDDDDDVVVNIAPRRGRGTQAFVSDAHAREADEYIDGKRGGLRRRRSSGNGDVGGNKGFLAAITDCCLVMFHTIVEAFAIACEYLTACCFSMTPRLCAMIVCVLTGVGLLVFAIVAIVSRAQGGGGGGTAPPASQFPDIIDSFRYETIRFIILDSGFTSTDSLDLPGTAQNYALRWLTDLDAAKIHDDDDALLQRYALATFYFSTYVFAEIADARSGAAAASSSAGGWTYGDYWMSEKGICLWFGVSCAPIIKEGVEEVQYNENSNVLRLNLTSNNVRGIIPSEISALENLLTLDLGDNRLQGTIPKSITSLQKIRKLCSRLWYCVLELN